MTVAPEIDVRDLGSVRRAAARAKSADRPVLLGEDWVTADGAAPADDRPHGARRGFAINRSPLARKIITFNLIALIILVAGMMWLAPARDNLATQRAAALVTEAELIADVFEVALPATGAVDLTRADIDVAALLARLDLRGGSRVTVHAPDGMLIGRATASTVQAPVNGLGVESAPTLLTDLLNRVWDGLAGLLGRRGGDSAGDDGPHAAGPDASLLQTARLSGTSVATDQSTTGETVFVVATPILRGSEVVGLVGVTSATGEIDALARAEREQLLQLFVIGILVSIGLSLVLASTIANPLAELAAAAEAGRDRHARKMAPTRIRIPDLTARPDEIGRLSGALRGMVSALYDRIESNEQFAADVAHEIKNPLASLRSAVGTMRLAKRDDQREKMLDIIDHDVSRLDRLVSDISAASRLDSELVREEEEQFDLLKMLGNLNEFLGREAAAKGIDYITDLPDGPVRILGLEGRLAQVFVNIITNAISFCDDGDAIRVWARQRGNRVLVVVEDTGPGIPENALTKIFQRFYSERPEGQFGNNSGLGLAISKQIVEAHGGVIWAENIRPTEADATSEPLGARFVVGLPV
jgi:two-component system, OmpR family, sensor histidine kinase ChvG